MRSEDLEREMAAVCEEIDRLLEFDCEIEAYLKTIPGPLRWLRAPGASLVRRDLARQIEALKMRNTILRNCCLEAKRSEERAPYSRRIAGPA
ncbi:MAG: hypothetical protein AB1425_10960 [Actinomycetota bacterium]